LDDPGFIELKVVGRMLLFSDSESKYYYPGAIEYPSNCNRHKELWDIAGNKAIKQSYRVETIKFLVQ
jgi:hypothetical protein